MRRVLTMDKYEIVVDEKLDKHQGIKEDMRPAKTTMGYRHMNLN